MDLKKYEYYRNDNGVLYCGDAVEITPLLQEEISLVLTDPPYGIIKSGTISKQRSHKNDYDTFIDSPEYLMNALIPFINNLSKNNYHFTYQFIIEES